MRSGVAWMEPAATLLAQASSEEWYERECARPVRE
jgi:hypothetical protein